MEQDSWAVRGWLSRLKELLAEPEVASFMATREGGDLPWWLSQVLQGLLDWLGRAGRTDDRPVDARLGQAGLVLEHSVNSVRDWTGDKSSTALRNGMYRALDLAACWLATLDGSLDGSLDQQLKQAAETVAKAAMQVDAVSCKVVVEGLRRHAARECSLTFDWGVGSLQWFGRGTDRATIARIKTALAALGRRLGELDRDAYGLNRLTGPAAECVLEWVWRVACQLLACLRQPRAFAPEGFAQHAFAVTQELDALTQATVVAAALYEVEQRAAPEGSLEDTPRVAGERARPDRPLRRRPAPGDETAEQ